MPPCHGGTLAPQARFEAPKGAPQPRRGLARGPRTLHQETPSVSLPLARASRTTLTRTGVVARTHLGPRRQAGRRAQPTHVRANLAQDVTRRGRIDPGNTVELLDLWQERLDEAGEMVGGGGRSPPPQIQ